MVLSVYYRAINSCDKMIFALQVPSLTVNPSHLPLSQNLERCLHHQVKRWFTLSCVQSTVSEPFSRLFCLLFRHKASDSGKCVSA